MSILAAKIGAARSESAKRIRKDIDFQIKYETSEAKSIQEQTGCSWSEALRIAHK